MDNKLYPDIPNFNGQFYKEVKPWKTLQKYLFCRRRSINFPTYLSIYININTALRVSFFI